MSKFKAEIKIIGINPYVEVPEKTLQKLFAAAGRDKGPIPIKGTINAKAYTQTLVKYAGEWRLYINTTMLANSPKRIGEVIAISVEYDDADRAIEAHPDLIKALSKNKAAKAVFDKLSPSRQNEIVRYISHLKTDESRVKNIMRAIDFLNGKGSFAGRQKP